jgi:hypothetical protein
MRKLRLLAALDSIIADLREATAAIQRDDYDAACDKLEQVSAGIRAQAEELKAA